jgi:hypothetical protein
MENAWCHSELWHNAKSGVENYIIERIDLHNVFDMLLPVMIDLSEVDEGFGSKMLVAIWL